MNQVTTPTKLSQDDAITQIPLIQEFNSHVLDLDRTQANIKDSFHLRLYFELANEVAQIAETTISSVGNSQSNHEDYIRLVQYTEKLKSGVESKCILTVSSYVDPVTVNTVEALFRWIIDNR